MVLMPLSLFFVLAKELANFPIWLITVSAIDLQHETAKQGSGGQVARWIISVDSLWGSP